MGNPEAESCPRARWTSEVRPDWGAMNKGHLGHNGAGKLHMAVSGAGCHGQDVARLGWCRRYDVATRGVSRPPRNGAEDVRARVARTWTDVAHQHVRGAKNGITAARMPFLLIAMPTVLFWANTLNEKGVSGLNLPKIMLASLTTTDIGEPFPSYSWHPLPLAMEEEYSTVTFPQSESSNKRF